MLKLFKHRSLGWWRGLTPIHRSLIFLIGLTLLMFGFTFSLIPLYDVFCKITGINGKVDLAITGNRLNAAVDPHHPDISHFSKKLKEELKEELNNEVAYQFHGRYRINNETNGRAITIEFDANVKPDLPFEFKPDHSAMQITTGTLQHTSYYVKNKTNKTMVIQAIPSISPGIVAKYLKKLECFCFTQQTLKPYEEAHMPLRFWLEPEFPDDVHRLTLSYTLFDVTKSVKEKRE